MRSSHTLSRCNSVNRHFSWPLVQAQQDSICTLHLWTSLARTRTHWINKTYHWHTRTHHSTVLVFHHHGRPNGARFLLSTVGRCTRQANTHTCEREESKTEENDKKGKPGYISVCNASTRFGYFFTAMCFTKHYEAWVNKNSVKTLLQRSQA